MIERSLATASARRGRGENARPEAIAASRTPPRTPGPAELGEAKNAPPAAAHRGLVRRPGFSAPAMDRERARRASDRDQGEGREAETAKKVQGIDAGIERDIHAQGSKHMSQKPLALAFDGDVMLVAAATASSPHGVRKCFGAPNGPF